MWPLNQGSTVFVPRVAKEGYWKHNNDNTSEIEEPATTIICDNSCVHMLCLHRDITVKKNTVILTCKRV